MEMGTDTIKVKPTAARKVTARRPKRRTALEAAPAEAQEAIVDVLCRERSVMIAEAAYYKSQARGFEPGHEVDDWLSAERAVEAMLGR